MQPLVEMRHVTFGYGGPPVLKDISLHLHAGQFAALVGPSGAGKSSLLRLLLGTLTPGAGNVLINGKDVTGRPSAHVGYVPQLETVNWNFPVTVEQVVLMGRVRRAGPLPWHARADHAMAAQLLEQLDIANLARRHIRELSGGQQQRVFLARALIAEPEILVLDEPTSGVDARTAENILHLLADLNRQGITVLMTTHDLNAASSHVPWVICLNQSIIAEGTPEAIFTAATLQRTYDAEFIVVRQEGVLLIQQKPHDHHWRDIIPHPVTGHTQPLAADPSIASVTQPEQANDGRLA